MMLRAVVSVHGHEHYVRTLKQEQRRIIPQTKASLFSVDLQWWICKCFLVKGQCASSELATGFPVYKKVFNLSQINK